MVSTHIHQHTDGTSISNCTEMGIQINPSKLKQSCQILSKSKSKPHTFSRWLSNRYRSGEGVWGCGCPYCILTKIWYTSFWSCRHIVALYWKLLQIYFTEKKKLGEWTTLWFLPPSQGINGCFGLEKQLHILQGEKQLTALTTLCFDLFLRIFMAALFINLKNSSQNWQPCALYLFLWVFTVALFIYFKEKNSSQNGQHCALCLFLRVFTVALFIYFKEENSSQNWQLCVLTSFSG